MELHYTRNGRQFSSHPIHRRRGATRQPYLPVERVFGLDATQHACRVLPSVHELVGRSQRSSPKNVVCADADRDRTRCRCSAPSSRPAPRAANEGDGHPLGLLRHAARPLRHLSSDTAGIGREEEPSMPEAPSMRSEKFSRRRRVGCSASHTGGRIRARPGRRSLVLYSVVIGERSLRLVSSTQARCGA